MEKGFILFISGGFSIYKRYILIMSVLTITLLALITSGCSSLTGPSGTITPTPRGVTLAPTAQPSVAAQPTGVTTSAEGTTISASVNQNVPLQMEKGAYMIKVKSQGTIGIDSVNPSGTSAVIASIYTENGGERSAVVQWVAPEKDTFKIYDVTKAYTVQILKLPLANPASPPKTFSGVGTQATDPITLKKGTATFAISCPDTAAGSDIQMFQVHLLDGNTGDELGTIAINMGNDPSKPLITNYNVQKTFDIPADGVYIIQIPIASPGASWTITVTQ